MNKAIDDLLTPEEAARYQEYRNRGTLALAAEIEQQQKEIARLRSLLELAKEIVDPDLGYCGVCEHFEENGHATDCKWMKFVKELEGMK